MSGSSLASYAAEMHAAAAAYDPESMIEVQADLRALEAALSDVAGAVRALAAKSLEQWPLHPGVSQAVSDVYAVLLKAAQAAADVPPALAVLHEDDLKRHQAPRPGERKWNV